MLQSEVARQVAKALSVTLSANENERLFQKYTTNIDAYDVFLQARRTVDSANKDALLKGEKLFARVIELDPDFAWGYIALGGAYVSNGDPVSGVDVVREALTLEPNSYEANLFMGFYLAFAGESALAVEHSLLAKRLGPGDSVRGMAFLAAAQFMNRNYTEAVRILSEMYRKFPRTTNPNIRAHFAAAYALLDKPEEAAAVAKKLLMDHPNFNLSQWKYISSYISEEDRTRIYNAAKKAGIPEFPKDE